MRIDPSRGALYTGLLATVVVALSAPGSSALHDSNVVLAEALQPAAAFFVTSITVGQIRDKYAPPLASEKRVRVLIVPGHQPGAGGTEFGSVFERDLVVDIADRLAALLRNNGHYDVIVARSKTAWHPDLLAYFDNHSDAIDSFRQSQAAQMARHLSEGRMRLSADQVYHHETATRAALELYGINKWASENEVDITLHLHLNDFAGRRTGQVGAYDGFAVYIPERQYSNARASKTIGVSIARRLSENHATSTFPREDVGVVEDQELIAIGSNNSADSAALLLEYGYIYEPQFTHAAVRALALDEYAMATYRGLQDFFNDVPTAERHGGLLDDVRALNLEIGTAGAGIYKLQMALRTLGLYPPSGRTLRECPISGVAGECTVMALKEYQDRRSLPQASTLSADTIAALKQDLAAP